MAELPIIRIAPNPDIRMQQTGDGQTFAIVDNFLEDPKALVSNVGLYAGDFVTAPMGHPSRGRDIGEKATQEIHSFFRAKLSKLFPFHRTGIRLKAFMSNVSLQPEELSAFHRMCHVDPRTSPDHCTFAGMLYLFENPELGGTAFYRWKARDIAIRAYELGSQKGDAAAFRYLEEHSEVYRKPPEYMTSSNDIAELLEVVPAKFNRAVFYDGEMPHSGHIMRPELLSSDPTKGRLALNIFASVRPKAA